MDLAILIPEFPGQTHAFFWREIRALRREGLSVAIVSTRAPRRAGWVHPWADEARHESVYLLDRRLLSAWRLVGMLRNPRRRLWWRAAINLASRQPTFRGRIRLLAIALLGAHLGLLARRRRWRHLHVHSCADAALLALFAHLATGLPYSLTLHGPLHDYGPFQREKWSHAAFAVVITHTLRQQVERQLHGSLPPLIAVAPMGVETERFARTTAYMPWPGSGPAQLFCCARLHPAKGHDTLLQALALLRQRGIDARLRIAGDADPAHDHYRAHLQSLARQLDIAHAAHWLGAIAEPMVARELERAQVFVLASRAEPLGVSLMEAMAAGLPVVATSAGGVPELIRDGVDGLLVPPGQPPALADAIERVLRDPALAHRLADSARQRVRESFHSQRSAQAIAHAWHRLHDPPVGDATPAPHVDPVPCASC